MGSDGKVMANGLFECAAEEISWAFWLNFVFRRRH
jgi:hypothetical protein